MEKDIQGTKESHFPSHFQKHVLLAKLPYFSSILTAHVFPLNSAKGEGTFFDVVPSTPTIIDVVIGHPHLPSVSSDILALAAAFKFEFLRFANPPSKSYYFDKVHFWEKNLFSPDEIVEFVYQNFTPFLLELQASLSIFYGRFDLESQTLTYLNYGLGPVLRKRSKPLEELEGPLKGPLLKPLRVKQVSFRYEDHFKFLSLDNESYVFSIQLHEPDHQLIRQNETAKFIGNFSQLKAVRLFVHQMCQQGRGNREQLSEQLQLAINEIFCNIVKHGYHSQVRGEVVIECERTEEGIYFTLLDKGDSFNPTETNYPDLTGEQENGFGFFMIQQIVDHLSYTPKTLDNHWNYFRIFKRYFSEEDQMEFSHRVHHKILIITPKGEHLDAKNAPVFKEGILNLIRTSGLSHLIFDLSHLQFIDSSGLGSFLSIQRSLNTQGGVLKLSNLNKPIQTMFEIVSMHRIFDIFPTVEEAIRSF